MSNLTPARARLLLAFSLARKVHGSWNGRSTQRPPSEEARLRQTSNAGCAEEPQVLSEAAWKRLEALNLRFESELTYADSYLADDPPHSRIRLLLANSSDLRKVAVLQRYVEKSYSFRLDDPKEGLRVADDLIAWTKDDASPLVAAIRRRAWMERGNLLRILGESAEAYAALEEAERELEASGAGDPLEFARYQEILGTLERDRGNFAAAAALYGKALAKVRRWGDSPRLQCLLASIGLLELYRGNFAAADALSEESLRVPEPDSVLLRFAAINRILASYFGGDPPKAYQALLKMRDGLGESWLHGFPEANRMTLLWSEGQIMTSLRLNEEAIGHLRTAREFFFREGPGSKVCHISIELALNYAAQSRFAEVRRELSVGLPFCSEDRALDRHAAEAMRLLQGKLEHHGRLEEGQIRAVNDWLDGIHRAPLQAHLDGLAGLQI